MITALAILLATSLAAVVLWCRALVSANMNLRDRLDATQSLADQYRHDRDVRAVELEVARAQRDQEARLRAIAEAQRNEAQRKTRDLLTRHIQEATHDEIRAMVADAFASPLSVVPPVSDDADDNAGPDDLINPIADVPSP